MSLIGLFPPVLKLFYQVNDCFIFHSIFHFSQNFLHSHFICEHNFLHHGGIFCQSREFVNAIKATSVTKPDFFIYEINAVIIVKQNEQYRDSCYTTSLMQLDAQRPPRYVFTKDL